MHYRDEPAIEDTAPGLPVSGDEPALDRRIAQLLDREPYGVLCTQGDGQPYGSVVALAATEDLRCLVFSTPTTTRKFSLLSACRRVAVVVDSRSRFLEDLTNVEAVTATGRATRIEPGPEFDSLAARLIARHGQLRSFVLAPSTALIRIDVYRYFHVVRFQEVSEWIPPSR